MSTVSNRVVVRSSMTLSAPGAGIARPERSLFLEGSIGYELGKNN